MISECPRCNQNLRFSETNKARLLAALEKLPDNQTLKFKCPICKDLIELHHDGMPAMPAMPADAELYTHAESKIEVSSGQTAKSPVQADVSGKPQQKFANTISVNVPVPPKAPDISWLVRGKEVDAAIVENVMSAMIMVSNESIQHIVSETLKAESYQIYIPKNIDDAIESIRFKEYAIIVYHSQYEIDVPLKNQDFHKFLQQMSMNKRRYIYYILVGTEFHTLYDLEALANSANVVINEKEMSFFSTILTKMKADYRTLFNPYCSMLKTHGKM
ncbi:MAG: hypothetical protein HQK77_20110 [Desulfobacterales bacterium]|nr:hypothetical protein [Desulfobacterales bacterium]